MPSLIIEMLNLPKMLIPCISSAQSSKQKLIFKDPEQAGPSKTSVLTSCKINSKEVAALEQAKLSNSKKPEQDSQGTLTKLFNKNLNKFKNKGKGKKATKGHTKNSSNNNNLGSSFGHGKDGSNKTGKSGQNDLVPIPISSNLDNAPIKAGTKKVDPQKKASALDYSSLDPKQSLASKKLKQ